MKGIDISHYQSKVNWDQLHVDFLILKASEGQSFVDPKLKEYKREARIKGFPLGYYHFANGTNPGKEADHFVKTVGDILEGEFLVLDWEIKHADPDTWCREFLDRVKEQVGFKPLIYMSSSVASGRAWSKVRAGDYGLWVAKYGTNNGQMQGSPSIGQWPFYVLWQYTSAGKIDGITGNVDCNFTPIDLATLKKYGKIVAIPPNPEPVPPPKITLPMEPKYITQEFGANPATYAQFGMRGHNGTDFRTKQPDTPQGRRYVYAVMDGKVIEVKDDGNNGYGKYIRLGHRGTEQTLYGHLYSFKVKLNQTVKAGDVIAISDNSGFSSAPHLHFGWRPDKFDINNGFKGYVDPRGLLGKLV